MLSFLAQSSTQIGAVVTELLTPLFVLTAAVEGEMERENVFAKLKKGFIHMMQSQRFKIHYCRSALVINMLRAIMYKAII